jgi:hypothetical protein
MKTLKSEEVHLWEYRTMEDVQQRIPYFIEDPKFLNLCPKSWNELRYMV